jgi:hypothetical protein
MPQRYDDHWYSSGHHLLFVKDSLAKRPTETARSMAHRVRPVNRSQPAGRVEVASDDQHRVAERIESVA